MGVMPAQQGRDASRCLWLSAGAMLALYAGSQTFLAFAPAPAASKAPLGGARQPMQIPIASSFGSDEETAGRLVKGSEAPRARKPKVAMYGNNQGGRNNWGQMGNRGRLKAAKKKSIMRLRAPYGSPRARARPFRYKLYDILEEMYNEIPEFTIVAEPEFEKKPTPRVPLKERYPWAPDFDVPGIKQFLEAYDKGKGLDPYWAPIWGAGGQVHGRAQKYIHRKGSPFAKSKWPMWDHIPEKGTERQWQRTKDLRRTPYTLNGRNRLETALDDEWWTSWHDSHTQMWQKEKGPRTAFEAEKLKYEQEAEEELEEFEEDEEDEEEEDE